MKLSKRAFSIKFSIEVQWLSVLCESGVIHFEVKQGKRTTILIEDAEIDKLVEGEHYVVCQYCTKKMSCITNRHYNVCTPSSDLACTYSKLYILTHKKTEDMRTAQSKNLKNRFLTPEGEITRKEIKEASLRLNSDPEFLKRKGIISSEIQNRPENKLKRGLESKRRWEDPEFRKRMEEYAEKNIEKLRKACAKMRANSNKKSSKLHLRYKENLINKGVQSFITEYQFDYYRLDEADPLAKIAVEVDGCYWHGCDSCGFPGEDRIIAIDNRKTSYLQNRGWVIIHVKECDIKKDPNTAIVMIKELQIKRREEARKEIKESFLNGTLRVKSMVNKEEKPQWVPVSDVLRHRTPHKRMIEVITESGASIKVTEDHSLFDGVTKEPIKTSDLKPGDSIVGLVDRDFGTIKVKEVRELPSEEFTYDLSVPGSENFVVDSGILAHNSYSISGVSLDIDKSSKYQSMKENFIQEYDKVVDAAKRSIKIIKGLKQPRYGIGISSALGPFSGNGVQSRANWVRGGGFS